MAAPFLAWGVAVSVIYGITIDRLSKVSSPFRMLNMINFLVFRITRGVVFTLELVLAEGAEAKEAARYNLQVRHEDFIADYYTFLYGTRSLENLELTLHSANPLGVDKPALFEDQGLADVFYR
ncbi:hypothetical protein MNEG_15855 [Monoraphidium neglectum]|uniref:Uncharacterized protein n=1 Tax=Monoraphidium neglectum TaxID=145388 RepID=A0A0D2K7F6_9CHLO|nr:hypothetical protein MNEG_15855 [Monoraphidium neglectum]KIY92108.1 hypothetical protein MNEG_15855 [Monoraphidium neglectum]|eukprot:XP_013891128.1 hypothetical protein MNEG_15855 [Monoraphidium neglectum]